jgi:hypothetical protein
MIANHEIVAGYLEVEAAVKATPRNQPLPSWIPVNETVYSIDKTSYPFELPTIPLSFDTAEIERGLDRPPRRRGKIEVSEIEEEKNGQQ